jgi:formate--tetrahydrofolate ligase
VKKFGVPIAVAVNHFISDTDAEVEAVKDYCKTHGVQAFKCLHWAKGGEGIEELSKHVAELADKGGAQFKPIYNDDIPLFEKVSTIAKEIYRADEVIADKSVRDQLKTWEAAGYGKFPICIAKTQYSFTTDPNMKGAPNHHTIPVREVRLSAGAEFIVVICGDIMTMPGLPKVPSAEVIGLDAGGQIQGLF